ncbi:MAG: kinesin-like protein Klp5 [Vezdaea aestivalis]|nr:MAG: kinesin-like protein Klp5 [Vezdaea aestivalis]
MASDGASSISVTIRVRPFTIREAAQLTKCDDGPLFLGDGSLAAAPTPKLHQKGLRSVVKVVDDKCLVFDPPEDSPVQRFSRSVVPTGKRVKDQTFGFDRVFDENTSQGDVYEATTRSLLDSVLDGYNATVFAYGATGCGKTHTITGTTQQPGIIFLTMQELFEKIAERREDKVAEVSLSYLEIYNETIRDLLVEPGATRGTLMLREDANHAVSVAGLTSHHPQNVQEVMDMVMQGNELRTMSPTAANATSSRSHAVLQVNVSQKDRNADVNEPHTMATLSIIDLAGSERASATKNRGERLVEGANINKSLLALGSCINALCDPRKKNHVPYRNSKLTRLLKFSLGGNCKTVMIVCVSPSSQHFDETQNTLRYANRAKNIQTKVTRNVYNVNRHVKDFLKKIDEQMALIKELKAQQKDSEGAAFAKFKRQAEKKDAIAKDGVARIRSAYENSSTDRNEKTTNMKKLRQIERRIAMLSSWIAAFDNICDQREDEEPQANLVAMRKTAQGILIELEGSRQHYHQCLAKSNWTRAIDSALQTGIRQIQEIDSTNASSEVASLIKEAELFKAMAEKEGLQAVAEQDKSGDALTVQALLAAHFETVACLNEILSMDENSAVIKARTILAKVLNASTTAAIQIVQPDGKSAIVEAFPPTKTGTPKRKKQIQYGISPAKHLPIPVLADFAQCSNSPAKMSPRRRKAGLARKGVSFTPVKKSPSKRAVRWRDDTEDGKLAEYEKTPQKMDYSPETSPQDTTETSLPLPVAPTSSPLDTAVTDSSPLPTPPEPSLDIRPKSNRFQAGFLAKKSEISPPIPRLTSLSSDTDVSPLRPLDAGKINNRSSLQFVSNSPLNSTPQDSASSSDSDSSKRKRFSDIGRLKPGARQKRQSLMALGTTSNSAMRAQRRRSPPSSVSGSPPSENAMFTSGQARRMVRSEKENAGLPMVLSPRSNAISKNGRRATGSDLRSSLGLGTSGAVRLSGSVGGAGRIRDSISGTSSGAWR